MIPRNFYSGTESDRCQVLIQVEAPNATIVAADAVVRIHTADGVGAVAANDGVARVDAGSLHLEDRRVGAPEVADFAMEIIAMAALRFKKSVMFLTTEDKEAQSYQKGVSHVQIT